ncbi:MAG: hypothetical protein QM578_23355 [Pantoea sp.]|uniref:hypothetical protein n=1 Tax=Pantoea sp. TaxID=69393 RepID=UPI0039E370FD
MKTTFKKVAPLFFLFTLTGCQQLQDGVKSLDSSINDLNNKMRGTTGNSVKSTKTNDLDLSNASMISGLGSICSDYEGNSMSASKKWENKIVSIRQAKLIKVTEFNSAKTMGADVHGEYGVLFTTRDTNKCIGTFHIEYYAGLENDILKYKKGDVVNLTGKIVELTTASNWSEYKATSGDSIVVKLTGSISK